MQFDIMEEYLRKSTKDGFFSVEDFRCLGLHKYMHPNAIGVFFTRLVSQGKIEEMGVIKATHKKAHGRKISIWRWI